jgi:hypothetical protein
MTNSVKRKIIMKQHLEKLRNVKKQLSNPLSHIMCCKSYIFEKQFETQEIKKKLDFIRHKLNSNIISKSISKTPNIPSLYRNLELYDCNEYENLLLWFHTDQCKSPVDKYALTDFNYNDNNSIFTQLYSQINESKLVQTMLHYMKITTQPLLVIAIAIIINTILLYSVFSIKFRIMVPVTSLISMMTKSILIKNNLMNLFMKNLDTAKHITYTVALFCIGNFIHHMYDLYANYLEHIEIIYYKIYDFRYMILSMCDIVKNYRDVNEDGYDTLIYFIDNLSDIYENNRDERNWWFFFRYGGSIISDFYKISNKKNKLGKLFNINGQIAYLSL